MNITETIKKFIIITNFQRKKLFYVYALMIIAAIVDVLSIGSLFPIFNQLIMGETNFFLSDKMDYLYTFFGIENDLIFFLILTFFLFSIKNLFMFYYMKISSYYFSYLTIFHQEKILESFLSKRYDWLSNKDSSFFVREIIMEAKQLNTNFVQPILTILLNLITILFFSIFLINVNFEYTVYLIVFSLLFYFTFALIFRKKIIFFGSQRRLLYHKMIDNVKQIFEGIRELTVYQKKNFLRSDLKKRLNRMANLNVTRSLISNIPRLLLEVMVVFLFLIAVLFNQDNSQQYLATIGIFVASSFRIMPNVISLIRSYQRMNFSNTASDYLTPILKEVELDKKNQIQLQKKDLKFNDSFELRDFSFNYNDQKIFENANLFIKKNSCIGIQGESGCGKSTLVDIICGLLKIDNGSIYLDGEEQDIHEEENWKNQISYIQQSIYIFDANIFENIALENDQSKINHKLIDEILSNLNIHEFSKKKDDSLGELGARISGGQAQRIGIARALYNDSSIIIFDESFNSLDSKNYKQILNLINKLKKNKTIIIISHDEKDFLLCDKKYKIKNKKILDLN